MLSNFKPRSCLAAVPVIILALVLIVGCDSKSTLNDVPSNTQVTVNASPTTVNIAATSVVEATVLSGSTGVANQVVTFTVTPANAGSFLPTTDTTDANGIVATIFTATTSGSATISATVGGTTSAGTIGITVNQNAQIGNGNIDVSASQSLLLANGSDTSQVTVTVRDELGQLASDSTVVKFAAGEKFLDLDANGYWSEGIDSLVFDANANGSWDGIGFIPSVAYTINGAVTVDYVSGNDAYTVYVVATVNDNGILGSSEVTIQLSPNAAINAIYLTSDSMQLSVKGTGGIETGLLRAVAYDINGNTVPEGQPINFYILDGPAGVRLGNVGTGPFPAITNGQGVATANIHADSVSGTVRVRAQADTVLSNAAQLLISAGPPLNIAVGATDCNVDFWAVVDGEQIIVAVVTDKYNNPVNDSTVVYFTTDEGSMKSHEERTKEHEGRAYSKWFSGINLDTDPNVLPSDRGAGRVLITAETSGGTVTASSYFFNTHIPAVMSVSGAPASMEANGETDVFVVVSAVDVNNNPVISGTQFKGDAAYSTTGGGTFEDGCNWAEDRVKITAPTLKTDASMPGGNDDGIGAIDLITYWSGGAAVSFNITLTTGNSYTKNSTFDGATTASPLETMAFSVLIKDRFGNPLGDHSITISCPDGTFISATTKETNKYGEANGFLWQAPNSAGSTTITITDTDPLGGITLTKGITIE